MDEVACKVVGASEVMPSPDLDEITPFDLSAIFLIFAFAKNMLSFSM